MQKKIMAAAVAGALALPAAVTYAQSSTVQIYGRITYEYGFISSMGNREDTDYADSPGGSAIGFRGEEKLGGGLSAWFQCESSADVRAMDQTGFCTRNSAVGFKGGFGNVFLGRWDTPFKRTGAATTVGGGDTGLWGTAFLLVGGSTSTQGSDLDSSGTVGTNGGGGRATFRR
ncbi:MAG: porin, partial [Burkholderiales bacterium]